MMFKISQIDITLNRQACVFGIIYERGPVMRAFENSDRPTYLHAEN